jgi:hypothetical protein
VRPRAEDFGAVELRFAAGPIVVDLDEARRLFVALCAVPLIARGAVLIVAGETDDAGRDRP